MNQTESVEVKQNKNSVKLISSNKLITVDNFEEDTTVEKSGRKWVLVSNDGVKLDLKMQVKNCCVKYTPEKYDKITIELDNRSIEFFEKLQGLINTKVTTENIIKGSTIGLKMDKVTKTECLRNLTRGDYFDGIISFNDVWTVNKKNYVSLELIQFRKLENKPKIEAINYFVDEI